MRALEWINDNPLDCVICTDIRSMHQAMEKNDWRDTDPWIKQIKELVHQIDTNIKVLWIPSHCGVPGNERADELANIGARMDQGGIPVTHKIVKAKIKGRKWEIDQSTDAGRRAQEMYKERRQPRFEMEGKWPRVVRTLYSRLRTGHAKELRWYRYLIETEDDPWCEACGDQEETIDHILCKCAALEEERARYGGGITMEKMVTDPETCRRILMKRFAGL